MPLVTLETILDGTIFCSVSGNPAVRNAFVTALSVFWGCWVGWVPASSSPNAAPGRNRLVEWGDSLKEACCHDFSFSMSMQTSQNKFFDWLLTKSGLEHLYQAMLGQGLSQVHLLHTPWVSPKHSAWCSYRHVRNLPTQKRRTLGAAVQIPVLLWPVIWFSTQYIVPPPYFDVLMDLLTFFNDHTGFTGLNWVCKRT